MDSKYNHLDHEDKIYAFWQSQGVFKAPTKVEALSKNQKPFTIIMPPPNANDPLHVGHAMFISIEDILIRYHRMLGEASLWLPGTDHAGIETQYVFEKKLAKEGKSRFQFDRNSLYQMIWDYVQNNSGVAIDQMKKMGASADFDRYKFTLDPVVVSQVLNTFLKMNSDNLIYRSERLVNYCVKCGTAYSELEVVYQEKSDKLYYVSYNSQSGDPLVVATVRPETIFADVAIAIHPTHPRAQELAGKFVSNPLTNASIPVVIDEAVDPEFGTGALKITPGHDPVDYEIGQRHQLPLVQVIGFDGKLTSVAGVKYEGLKVGPARELVVTALTESKNLIKVDNYTHNVSCCYRCSSVIEPLPLAQFFIKVKPLTEKVISALNNDETKVIGAGHDKILHHWLSNLKDWNISRQIVWGIRMPIWYEINPDKLSSNHQIVVKFINKSGEIINGKVIDLLASYSISELESGLQSLSAPKDAVYTVSLVKPGENYLQETDTFDTWFSSSQWPVVTLTPEDFDFYYPTSVMETAYDILMFWVMRMMMMGTYLTGKMPFKHVYLHGLVRDEKGQKMSKSKGNVINPLDLVAKYGADSLRMALVMSSTAGHDSAVGEMKVKGMRNFTNKVWNASRFVKMQLESTESKPNQSFPKDQEFVIRLNQIITDVTKQLNDFKIGLAAETLHNEFWHWYCDQAIEDCKANLLSPTQLEHGLETFLKLMHPFMPFLTESIWQEIKPNQVIATLDWPKSFN